MNARQGVMKITVGSEVTRFLGKACTCFLRNSAQVNDLNRVASKQAKLEFSPEGRG